MILGIGVDTVNINEIERLINVTNGAFIKSTYTKKELEFSKNRKNKTEYFASRFAAKEAIYKAISSYVNKFDFDFRKIEVLNEEDGRPFVVINESIKNVFKMIGDCKIWITITTENEYATAFAVLEKN